MTDLIILMAWLLCGGTTAVLAFREYGDDFGPFDYFMCVYCLVGGPLSLLGWLLSWLLTDWLFK